MQTTVLGKTGVHVSCLCMGTMSFGDVADEATSAKMYHRCREAGINLFDCANVYSRGKAEEILGRLIRGERSQVVISSKVGFPMGDDVGETGLSRRHIVASVDASLQRLNTDWIDILFLHRFDPDVCMEDTLWTLDQLVRQGKVLYTGVSNWAAWQVGKGVRICSQEGFVPIACVQPMYNLVKRQAEVEILPMAMDEGLGVLTYSPLGGGLLTGRYAAGETTSLRRGRLTENSLYAARYGRGTDHATARKLVSFAHERGMSPATLAVAWVMSHPAVTAPILGARDVEQLEASLAAAEFSMSTELYAQISTLSITPSPATDRLEEQQGIEYKGSGEIYR